MPIYEYKCKDCGSISEYLIGVGKGDEDIRCKGCGGSHMERVLSTANLSKSGSMIASHGGTTCCGRQERCETPPCSAGGGCKR